MTATAPPQGEPGPAARTMRGREREWEGALGLLRAADAGRAGVLLIEGTPGAGKTLLLEEAVRAAAVRGLTPAAGRACETSGPAVPGEPLLSALYETVETGESGAWPEPSVERLRSSLEKRAAAGPVLVSLDDLQWAGAGTLAAVGTLCRDLAGRPVAWLLARCTSACGDAAGDLFDLLEREGAQRRSLEPLGDEALTEIAIDLLGGLPDDDVVAFAAGAGGNPYLLTELLTGLRDEGAVRISGGRARLSSARLPERVRAGVGRRLRGLSPRTRHLLTVSAVLGRSFSPEDVAEILATTPAAILPGLDEALSANLLAATPDALCFRHELVRWVIVEAVPPPVRRALHRQIGELLAGRPAAAAAAAAHLARGVRAGDDRALAKLDQVIATVLPRSPQGAAELAVLALELTGAGPDRPERTLTAVAALGATGRLEEAARLARAAFARPMPALTCARLHCLLSDVLHLRGRAYEAAAEAAAALAEPCLSDGLRDDAELALLNARGNAEEVRRRAEAIVSGAGEHGDALVAGAFLTLALGEWDAGGLTAGLALTREAVRRASLADDARAGQPGDQRAGASSDRATGRVPGRLSEHLADNRVHPRLVLAMQLADAQRHDDAGTVLASAGGCSLAWAAAPAVLRARTHLAAGRFHDAAAEAEAALATGGGLGPHLLVSSARAVLAAATLRTGDVHAAHRHVTADRHVGAEGQVGVDGQMVTEGQVGAKGRMVAEGQVGEKRQVAAEEQVAVERQGGVGMPAHGCAYAQPALTLVAAQVGEARDGPGSLVESFGPLREEVLRHRWTLVADPAAAAWLVRTAHALGDRVTAEAVVEAAERLAEDNPAFPAARVAAGHARGLLDGSPAALERAAAGHTDPWARASAAEDLAVLITPPAAGAGENATTADTRRRTIAAFDAALSGYEAIGATRDAARVRRRLRRLGVRRRNWSHTDRPLTGWASLTDTERAVSELVAQGLTNRQVADQLSMSAHTVAFHLRHVFRKLDIGSRVELARLALQRSA